MYETKIKILNASNETLVGIKTMPRRSGEQLPAVILIHGFGVTKEEDGMFDSFANSLASSGICAFRFNSSGCGESEGDYSDISLSKMKLEVTKILQYVKNQPEVDESKIGILGQSFGTSAVLISQEDIKTIVLMGTIIHPNSILRKIFGTGYNKDKTSILLKSRGRKIAVKPEFWRDFEKHNILEAIKKIKSPTLLIHGGEDIKVPVSEMNECFENLDGAKEKVIIAGADHGLRPHRDKVTKIITNWFEKHLQ